MPKLEKDLMLKDLEGFLKTNSAVFMAEYSGISPNELNGFRKNVRKGGGACRVVKNSVSKAALSSGPWKGLLDYLSGPTMLIFAGENSMEVVKTVSGFADEQEGFKIKAGVMENLVMDSERVLEIAKLPSREILLGRLLCGFISPLSRFVNIINAPLGAFVSLISTIGGKTGGNDDDGKGS